MLAKVFSSAVLGVDAYQVEVEVDISSGLPSFNTVGLPDVAVKESKDRVRAAVRNSGYEFPVNRITVNLAPADVRKEGSSFDLPIALGILLATGQIESTDFLNLFIMGELSLDGSVRRVPGALPMAVAVRENGKKGIILPLDNADEAAVVTGIDVLPVKTLLEAVTALEGFEAREPYTIDLDEVFRQSSQYEEDFHDVKGQAHVKRALEVAAAGGHNILMLGPPGSGKTMLAKRIATILPDMTLEESLETTKIHSITGLLSARQALVATRPFRSPHHTISNIALVGGGNIPRAGEVSLAHHGVLFLDELPEFNRNALEVLRQPMEDGVVTIARAAYSLTYPATFMLAAAMNPCPCGNLTDPMKECTCHPFQVQRYMAKISGPLLDRIDIHVEVPALKYRELAGNASTGEPSSVIRERVQKARDRQHQRLGEEGLFCNAQMQSKQIKNYCQITSEAADLLKMAITRLGISARAYDRILKVSRTIADLAASKTIEAEHISEAIQYRSLDRALWVS